MLRQRFVENRTQSEISGDFGVSQMQISRIQRRALNKLLGAVRGSESMESDPQSGTRRKSDG